MRFIKKEVQLMNDVSVSNPLSLAAVRLEDEFWSTYMNLVRDVVVPYQWEALSDRIAGVEPSRSIRNLKIAAGLEQGDYYGMVFQDSDVAKWIEAAAYLLAAQPDEELERTVDELVAVIAQAQRDDGYLNTYFTLKEPGRRWSNLAECHELYCAGHWIEAAVAYSDATGKRALLDVACRLADCIASAFGPKPGQIQGYDGHPEIELALVKLYRATGDVNYLELARFFVDERGREPHFYDREFEARGQEVHFTALDIVHDKAYSQAHVPVRQMKSAEGHAVRLVYLCTAMADIVLETGDTELMAACRRLWSSIVARRMYITGAIGSMAHGEAFTLDYDLPADTAYAETCASIGLMFFAQRMLRIEPKREYADVLEQALYNTVISGVSRDGKRFFYVNPLEVRPDVCGMNPIYDHVKAERQGWFGVACCPPNIARTIASLDRYVYTVRERTLYVHLYAGSRAKLNMDGEEFAIVQLSKLPWQGSVRFEVEADRAVSFTLALRLPHWSPNAQLLLNGEPYALDNTNQENGYLTVSRDWAPGDCLELALAMPVRRMRGHPSIRDTVGKTTLQRGPLVYCLEENDNGPDLHRIALDPQAPASTQFEADLLGGLQTIAVPAFRTVADHWGDHLYKADESWSFEPVTARFIPYFAWANRGLGEMAVWVRERNPNVTGGAADTIAETN
jgi:hypothetical protein